MSDHLDGAREPWTGLLARRDVLAGLMFIAIAAFGLWLSRDYTMGTTLRMGTGYVPRLLCWLLLVLGAIVFVGGLRGTNATRLARSAGVKPDSGRPWNSAVPVYP